MSKSGQEELFPPPPTHHFHMAEEVAHMQEVLAHENMEFQAELVAMVDHAYLTFFYYTPKFIGASFSTYCTLCIFPNFQNFFFTNFQYFRVWIHSGVMWRLPWCSGSEMKSPLRKTSVYSFLYIL